MFDHSVWRGRRGVFVLASVSTLLASAELRAEETAPLDLAAVLRYAEGHAPRLSIARERPAIAEAQLSGARSLFHENPSLELEAGPRFAGGVTDVDFVAALSQPVEIAGQRGLRIAEGERAIARAQAALNSERWRLRQDVRAAFVAVLVAEAHVEYTGAWLELASDVARLAERRLALGEASALESRFAEADLAEAKDTRLLAERAEAIARVSLAELLGWPLDTPLLTRGELVSGAPLPKLEALLGAVTATHPELSELEAALFEADAGAERVERELWPTPSLGVSFEREGGAGGTTSHIVLGTLAVPLPLWNQNEAARGTAAGERVIAERTLATARRGLEARRARAHAAAIAAERRVAAYDAARPQSADALRLLKKGLEAGELSIPDVSAAKSRFLRVERAALEALGDYHAARIELEAALGLELGEVRP